MSLELKRYFWANGKFLLPFIILFLIILSSQSLAYVAVGDLIGVSLQDSDEDTQRGTNIYFLHGAFLKEFLKKTNVKLENTNGIETIMIVTRQMLERYRKLNNVVVHAVPEILQGLVYFYGADIDKIFVSELIKRSKYSVKSTNNVTVGDDFLFLEGKEAIDVLLKNVSSLEKVSPIFKKEINIKGFYESDISYLLDYLEIVKSEQIPSYGAAIILSGEPKEQIIDKFSLDGFRVHSEDMEPIVILTGIIGKSVFEENKKYNSLGLDINYGTSSLVLITGYVAGLIYDAYLDELKIKGLTLPNDINIHIVTGFTVGAIVGKIFYGKHVFEKFGSTNFFITYDDFADKNAKELVELIEKEKVCFVGYDNIAAATTLVVVDRKINEYFIQLSEFQYVFELGEECENCFIVRNEFFPSTGISGNRYLFEFYIYP